MMRLPILLLLFLISLKGFAYRKSDTHIINECLWNQKLIYPDVDCNHLYHHYKPPADNKGKKDKDQVRIGSFNIFKLGTSDSKFKNLKLVAKIIDRRWDVVALSEVQHNSSIKLEGNAAAIEALGKGLFQEKLIAKAYGTPSYLKLLLELQKRDPHWGLILSPIGQSANSELLGFFYRKGSVDPIASEYCQDHMDELSSSPLTVYQELRAGPDFTTKDGPGCPSGKDDICEVVERVSKGRGTYPNGTSREFISPTEKPHSCLLELEGRERDDFSKIPMVARFRSGKFDFSLVTIHIRFRQPGLEKPTTGGRPRCLERCQKIGEEFLALLGMKDFTSIDNNDLEVARFFETNAIFKETEEISQAESDGDVILAGDFNLELESVENQDDDREWEKILENFPGARVYITGKTSISGKKGLKSNYDHFVFIPGENNTIECDPETAREVDFTHKGFTPGATIKRALNPKTQGKVLKDYELIYRDRYRIVDDIAFPLWDLSTDEREKLILEHGSDDPEKFEKQLARITEREISDCRTGKKRKLSLTQAYLHELHCRVFWQSELSEQKLIKGEERKEPFRPYINLISDHLPIEMTCENSMPDDD